MSLLLYASMILTHNLLLQDEVITKPFLNNELLPKMREVIQRVKTNDIRCVSTESVGSNSAVFLSTSAALTGSGYSTLTNSSGELCMAVLLKQLIMYPRLRLW
jgi:DNA-binding response OmpR family regulator